MQTKIKEYLLSSTVLTKLVTLVAGLCLLLAWVTKTHQVTALPAAPEALSGSSTPGMRKPIGVDLEQAKTVVKSSTHGELHAVRVFSGVFGLTGVVLKGAQNTENVGWISPEGTTLFLGGSLLTETGEDLSMAARRSQGLLLSLRAAQEQAASVTAGGINVGVKGPLITVFLDPNCSYCNSLYHNLAEHVAKGHVRVHYVLIGLLNATSAPRAISILASPHPEAALAANESAFNHKTEQGGYPVKKTLSSDSIAAVSANNTLFFKVGAVGTPAILYCSRSANGMRLAQGAAEDINAFLADVRPESEKKCG